MAASWCRISSDLPTDGSRKDQVDADTKVGCAKRIHSTLLRDGFQVPVDQPPRGKKLTLFSISKLLRL